MALEDSENDDSFPNDELDDLYPGSGSGYFEQESGIETDKRFSPGVSLAMSTRPVVLPTMDIQPVGTPFEELPLSDHPKASHQPPTGDRGARRAQPESHHAHSHGYHY